MYTITIIRLHSETNVFQNTETHSVTTAKKIEEMLAEHNATFEQVERFLNLNVYGTTIIEVHKLELNKMWFIYITRIK